jgi:hypothetical protein
MTSSQFVLLGLIGLFIAYIVRMRSAAADRLMYLGLAALGIGLVLNPELTNQAAAALGIGRGADLMFYFFIVFCLFHFAATAATLRRLQHDLGELTRALALLRASLPNDQPLPPRGG